MSIDQIRRKIESIREDELKLYSFLYDLTYNEMSKNPSFLETIYIPFLQDERSEIRRVAIYCLLFGLQIRKPEYKKITMLNLQNRQNDIELRLTCIMSLSQAYANTNDKELLSVFYNIFYDIDEEEDVRPECFVAMMKIHGLDSVKILKKNRNRIIMSMEDLHIDEFEKELIEISAIAD